MPLSASERQSGWVLGGRRTRTSVYFGKTLPIFRKLRPLNLGGYERFIRLSGRDHLADQHFKRVPYVPSVISSKAIFTCCQVELLRQEVTGHFFPSTSSATAARAAGSQLGLFSNRMTIGCTNRRCLTPSLPMAKVYTEWHLSQYYGIGNNKH